MMKKSKIEVETCLEVATALVGRFKHKRWSENIQQLTGVVDRVLFNGCCLKLIIREFIIQLTPTLTDFKGTTICICYILGGFLLLLV